ncbi:MAG TPA: hypothetical protein VFA90_10835 [Terriglobales bacterium]|nr:hypothetical protein [Terriglobales bacterium]
MATTKRNIFTSILLALGVVVVALAVFWLFGGVRWLDTKVFPPRRPKNMPEDAIWIDGARIAYFPASRLVVWVFDPVWEHSYLLQIGDTEW